MICDLVEAIKQKYSIKGESIYDARKIIKLLCNFDSGTKIKAFVSMYEPKVKKECVDEDRLSELAQKIEELEKLVDDLKDENRVLKGQVTKYKNKVAKAISECNN